MANSTNELLRAALNSGRTPSTQGRSSSRRSSARQTPRGSGSASRVLSRDVSDDEFDDTASFMSDETWVIVQEEEEGMGVKEEEITQEQQVEQVDNWEDIITAALDAMSEKRVSTREKALATIVRLFSHKYVGEELDNSRMSYLDSFKRSVKSTKSERESTLAARAIALWFINFGADAPEEYAEASELLKSIALTHKSANVRVLALSSLGVANFVAGVDYRDAAQLMQFVETNFLDVQTKAQPVAVIRQALETYGFLMTVAAGGDARLAEQLFESAFSAHIKALMAESVEVRVTAAQNFALVHEELSEENERFEFMRQEELLATLEMMKRESSKRHGKKGKSMQKSVIRDVLRTIEEGESPDLKLLFRGRAVHFDDWSQILRLHAFRASLGGGLPVQFVENPLLHDIFQVEFDLSASDFYKADGRVVVDSNSELAKSRAVNRRKQRDRRGHMLRGSGDDDGY